jgi:hypothetical protein
MAETGDTLADDAEALGCHGEIGGRVTHMGIEAERDQQDGGVEPANGLETGFDRGDTA